MGDPKFERTTNAERIIQLVDRLVGSWQLFLHMKTMEIGAFEAKTRFSELLRHVEDGGLVRVFRRNRHVADLVGSRLDQSKDAMEALSRLSARRHARKAMTSAEIRKLRDEGRKR